MLPMLRWIFDVLSYRCQEELLAHELESIDIC
jgi:hypothetical protein